MCAGADELNSLIVLILSLQPEQTTRENLPVVRRDLKVLTSRALFFFQESLQTLDVVQVIYHHPGKVYVISSDIMSTVLSGDFHIALAMSGGLCHYGYLHFKI